MLGEVKHDGSCLEDRKTLRSGSGRSVSVHQNRNFAVRIQGVDVPWFLLLVCPDLDVLDTGDDISHTESRN